MVDIVPEEEGVVTKRRVTMASIFLGADGNTYRQEATDYVRPDFLDAYVEDARTKWQVVEVSEEPDAGPGGYHGETHVPEGLNHPLAGTYFEATEPAAGGPVDPDPTPES